jgi:hypothetical protein
MALLPRVLVVVTLFIAALALLVSSQAQTGEKPAGTARQ